MKPVVVAVMLCWFLPAAVSAQSFQEEFQPLIQSACIHCHDGDTETPLNFDALDHDLTTTDTFRKWEKIFDRVHSGEMPPESESRPDARQLQTAMDALEKQLRETSLAKQRKHGRVPSRRLTRLEYAYTLQDLLLIDEDYGKVLPAETDTGGFDTVGANQGISSVHIRSYLTAADRALDEAIRLGAHPKPAPHKVDYYRSPYVNRWYKIPLDQGGRVIKKLDDGVALFVDLDYIMRSDLSGLRIKTPGNYRIHVEAAAYQARSPVTLKIILASEKRGGAELLGAFDLQPDQSRTVIVPAYMKPGDYLYPSVADAQPHAGVYLVGGAENYRGEGLSIKSFVVEGPLNDNWPPLSTRRLLTGMEIKQKSVSSAVRRLFDKDERNDKQQTARASLASKYDIVLTKPPLEHISDVITHVAPLAFRRPVTEDEVQSFVALAKPVLEDERPFTDALRVPLRSILTSPQFLFHAGEPGPLDDHSLASRLSFFLWKSMPDEELLDLAKQGKLTDPRVLAQQVDRLLKDEKSQRFVQDFLGQWLRLYEINATTPDEHLYPEFDDVLNQAIRQETELFFAHLIAENLTVTNLIDSDFAFLNRRLAEHYGIRDVDGQSFRKVNLPDKSPRGGILTHASIAKITANGTVTSPVTRGNFVLTNLLGTPPDPPLPNVGSIEPDTRGKTTIREILKAHRDTETCARCHQKIDPPGFAMESFDPIGGFRTRYRANTGTEVAFQGILRTKAYRNGPKVDASGETADGKSFSGIDEFKRHLMDQKDQVARHFISRLVVYATGGEIQFADREQLDAIAREASDNDYRVRDIIHQVVQSQLFRHK